MEKIGEISIEKIREALGNEKDIETRLKELEIINRLLIEKIKKLAQPNFENLREFGNENTGYISDRTLLKLVQYPTTSIMELIKIIHFDEKYPENHNLMIDDFDDNVVHIFNGEKWVPESFDEKMKPILENKIKILKEVFESEIENNALDDEAREKYNRFLERYENNDKCLMEYFSSELRYELEKQKRKLTKIRKLPYLN